MTFDNAATVTVPPMYRDDPIMTIEIEQYGVDTHGAATFRYTVRESGEVRITGDDLSGPAYGLWPEAADMAVTLATFLGAAYECGEITEHGRSYRAHELAWLETHSERLGSWAYDIENCEDN